MANRSFDNPGNGATNPTDVTVTTVVPAGYSPAAQLATPKRVMQGGTQGVIPTKPTPMTRVPSRRK